MGSNRHPLYIAPVRGRDDDDLMILQIKGGRALGSRAQYRPGSHTPREPGHRVVVGQHLMQAASDQFLGWANVGHHDFYIRRFRDMKGLDQPREDLEPMTEAYLLL